MQKEERKENRGDGIFIQRMYMRNIADTKWKDIRIADIILNGNNICSTADIPELYAIGFGTLKVFKKASTITRICGDVYGYM